MLNVGIGEYAISNNKDEMIVTHALGSCIALIIHCEKTKHTALAHIVLPDRHNYSKDLSLMKPGYFAEDIVPELIEFFTEKCKCSKAQLKIHIIGAADSMNKNDVFKVGKKNADKVINIISQYNLNPSSVNIGGNVSRTVSVNVNDGNVIVKEQVMII